MVWGLAGGRLGFLQRASLPVFSLLRLRLESREHRCTIEVYSKLLIFLRRARGHCCGAVGRTGVW